MNVVIRPSMPADGPAISRLVLAAFGDEGPDIVQLIDALLDDASARPLTSLVASVDDTVAGHVMFSRAVIADSGPAVTASILAPLAVHPDFQRQGLGRRLVEAGLAVQAASGVDRVFVLGDPALYSRFGFELAGPRGFQAPYPLSPLYEAGWQVQVLHAARGEAVKGRVKCADALAAPRYWQE